MSLTTTLILMGGSALLGRLTSKRQPPQITIPFEDINFTTQPSPEALLTTFTQTKLITVTKQKVLLPEDIYTPNDIANLLRENPIIINPLTMEFITPSTSNWVSIPTIGVPSRYLCIDVSPVTIKGVPDFVKSDILQLIFNIVIDLHNIPRSIESISCNATTPYNYRNFYDRT